MEKNIEDYLLFYLSSRIEVQILDQEGGGWNAPTIVPLIPYTLREINRGAYKALRILLRPLESMTEEEEAEYTTLIDKWNFGFKRNMLGAAESTRFLLSKHFDLFGLIDAGLAVNTTTLNSSPAALPNN